MVGPRLKLEDVPRFEALVGALKKAYRSYRRSRRGVKSLRDLALIAVLIYTGCRLGEALALTNQDVDPVAKTIRIMQLKKRRPHPRIVPVPSPLFWRIMNEYLEVLPGDKLFTITDRQARNIVYWFTRKYLGRRCRPHAIRHAYATYILKTTKNLETLRRLLGHEGYQVLKAYLDYTQEDLRTELEEAFSRLEII